MLDSQFYIHATKGPIIMMNQLKSIYNSPFKSSYSHPIHICFVTIASNVVVICTHTPSHQPSCNSRIYYRLATVNSNTVNSKFHFIQSFFEVSVKYFPVISYLNFTVNSYFHLIGSKTLLTNDFE